MPFSQRHTIYVTHLCNLTLILSELDLDLQMTFPMYISNLASFSTIQDILVKLLYCINLTSSSTKIIV